MIAAFIPALAGVIIFAFGLWLGLSAKTGPRATMGTALAFIA